NRPPARGLQARVLPDVSTRPFQKRVRRRHRPPRSLAAGRQVPLPVRQYAVGALPGQPAFLRAARLFHQGRPEGAAPVLRPVPAAVAGGSAPTAADARAPPARPCEYAPGPARQTLV